MSAGPGSVAQDCVLHMDADWDWISPSGTVRIRDDTVLITAATKAECRTSGKELRLVRQQLVIDRREIDAEIRGLRARWRRDGTVSNGVATSNQIGREIGRGIVRGLIGSRAGAADNEDRRRFDDELASLQQRRELVISKISNADRIILAIKERELQLERTEHPPELPPATCTSCGATEDPGARFCGQCGSRL